VSDTARLFGMILFRTCIPRIINIEMDLKEIRCGSVDWIHLAQDRVQWRAV